MQMRLDKFLSDSMEISRQDAKKLLSKGQVSVDGAVAKKGELKITDNSIVRLTEKQ